jgi:hypothetical protein
MGRAQFGVMRQLAAHAASCRVRQTLRTCPAHTGARARTNCGADVAPRRNINDFAYPEPMSHVIPHRGISSAVDTFAAEVVLSRGVRWRGPGLDVAPLLTGPALPVCRSPRGRASGPHSALRAPFRSPR